MENMNKKFLFFFGAIPKNEKRVDFTCLSNWFKCKFQDGEEGFEGLEYCCVEQYMMAKKALIFGDGESYKKIMGSTEPKEIKALGRKVQGFRKDVWDRQCDKILIAGLYYKFSQNEELKRYLLWTGDRVLAEANPWDTIWGIGMAFGEEGIEDEANWKGQNKLGKCLMRVREVLKEQEEALKQRQRKGG